MPASPTDLARLIARAVARRRPELWVTPAMVIAWQARAPETWREACEWLAQHKIPVLIVGRLLPPEGGTAAPAREARDDRPEGSAVVGG
jgi:hypothetical protein